MEKKFCFVIAPIGPPGSDTRKQSDVALRYIVKPALEDDYQVKRADDDSRPGEITVQMMSDIERADLIVANLTGLNPNVMYELGVAHSQGKKVIHIFDEGTKLPFDLRQSRSISFDVHDPKSHEQSAVELQRYEKALRDAKTVSNPFTEAMASPLRLNEEELKSQTIRDLIADYEELFERIEELERSGGRSNNKLVSRSGSGNHELLAAAEQLIDLLAGKSGFSRVAMDKQGNKNTLIVYGSRDLDVSVIPEEVLGARVSLSIE